MTFSDLVAQVLESATPPANIAVVVDSSVDFEADAVLMAQVMTNLIINAYQAMPEGGTIHLTASDGGTSQRGSRWRTAERASNQGRSVGCSTLSSPPGTKGNRLGTRHRAASGGAAQGTGPDREHARRRRHRLHRDPPSHQLTPTWRTVGWSSSLMTTGRCEVLWPRPSADGLRSRPG